MDIPKLLYEIIGDEAVLEPDCELLESGLLDSLALIELVNLLEEEGVTLHLTRIDRQRLKTTGSITELVTDHLFAGSQCRLIKCGFPRMHSRRDHDQIPVRQNCTVAIIDNSAADLVDGTHPHEAV